MAAILLGSLQFLTNLLESVQVAFPGGVMGLLVSSGTTFLILQQLYTNAQMLETKRSINKRQNLKDDNINAMRRQLELSDTTVDMSIVELPFLQLQSKLKSGALSCAGVLRAYQTKALQLDDRINCVTGFILNAEERATKLDALKPEQRGSLHGIPISLKEVVGVAGSDTTAGLSYYIGDIKQEYGIIVQVLINQGAIPFVRTNIPQGQLSYGCSNPIFGQTSNCYNTDRTCGGSSGGEGAILGGHASILGIGCDAGGSIRVPCHFCGVFGLKLTTDRLSEAGNIPLATGIDMVKEIYGPMGRDVDTLISFMKASLTPDQFRLDPLIPQIAWRQEMFEPSNKKPMKIGFYAHDGGLQSIPAVVRAVKLAKTSLEKMGHQVVEFHPPDAVGAVRDFIMSALMSDDGEMFSSVMKYDVIDPDLKMAMISMKIPYPVRWLVSKFAVFLHPVERELLLAKSAGSVFNWWEKNDAREHFRRKFTSLMQSQGLDALLCPAFPMPAFPLRQYAHSSAGMTYPALYSALDFPCGVHPVTKITAEDVQNMSHYPRKYMTDKYVHKICVGSENLPIAVQCISYPFHEEVVLRMMKELEKGLAKA